MGAWLLPATAVALAMDAFTVAVATGLSLKVASLRQTLRLAFHFGLFQALMPLAGWGLGASLHSLIENVDHWAAAGLLALVGAKMLVESRRKRRGREERRDPTRGVSLVMLSLATSMDALAVGFSLSLLRASIWQAVTVIGLTAASFTAVGMHIGRFVSASARLEPYAETLGGIILFGIGFAILREHGVFG